MYFCIFTKFLCKKDGRILEIRRKQEIMTLFFCRFLPATYLHTAPSVRQDCRQEEEQMLPDAFRCRLFSRRRINSRTIQVTISSIIQSSHYRKECSLPSIVPGCLSSIYLVLLKILHNKKSKSKVVNVTVFFQL